ncbi:MAG: potassium channel family protein [Candidatus Woesearchaeota archaeon]
MAEPKKEGVSAVDKLKKEILGHPDISKFPAKILSAHSLPVGNDEAKNDISLLKLINYIAIFFIPVLVFAAVALKMSAVYADYFEASAGVTAQIFMVPFMIIVFFFFIPYIRDREKIQGIRFSVVALTIIGVGIAFPSALKGNWDPMLMIPTYLASYILLTFIFCPEVLGIERNLRDWFKHKKQLSIIAIYLSIVLLYVIGFGGMFYDIYKDPANPDAFQFSVDKEPTLASFIYYSMVSYTSTGYGEILPVSTAARLVFFMEGLMALIINVLFIALLLVFISNAEFLSQQAEEKQIAKEFKKEEEEIKKEEHEIIKEEKEIKKVEKEVRNVEADESMMVKIYKNLKK